MEEGAQGARVHERAQGAQLHEGAQGAQLHEGAQGAQLHPGAQGARVEEGAQGAQVEDDVVPDLEDEVFVAGGDRVGEDDPDYLEWAARRAYQQTIEHAARRAAEREAAARRELAQANEGLAEQVDALYDDVGADAADDNIRERIASGDALPDEEDEAEAERQDQEEAQANANFRAAKGELFATILANIREAKWTYVDNFAKERYNNDPEKLLKDLRAFLSALVKIAVALAMGRAEHETTYVDRLALVHIKEIYVMGPMNLRQLVRQTYNRIATDVEMKYELAATLKSMEAAAVAVKRSFNETCNSLNYRDYIDHESELSYVTDGSRASALLRERELVVGQLLESAQAEADIIVPLSRGIDRESQIPTDQELYDLRTDRNRFLRIYRNTMINRWQARHAERLEPAPMPPQQRGERRPLFQPPIPQVRRQQEENPSPNASTVVEDFGLRGGPPPARRVRLNPNTPEQMLYTPEYAANRRAEAPLPPGPRQTPLSSTRMRSQETSINTSGFSQGLQGSERPTRFRPHNQEEGGETASAHSEPIFNRQNRRLFHDDLSAQAADRSSRREAERSLEEATTAKDVLEALKLTAQISLNNQRDFDKEYTETAVEDKEAWYLSLPRPWNVVPNKTEKYSDEMHKIRFLLNKADAEGSHLKRFTGREADYFDWRPVVIHGIHMKNVSIADKFYAILQAFKRNQDAFVDSLVRDQEPSPEAYEHIIVQLERQYGGERRAYTHAASALKFRAKLDAENQESVSDVYAEVRKYISFCQKNSMELYLQSGPTASELIKRFMPQKQIANMIRFCDLKGVREEDGSLYQVEAYLSRLLDIFAKEHEITGLQRLPSRRGGLGADRQNRSNTTPNPYYTRGTPAYRPFRGNRGYGNAGRGRGSQPYRRVYALQGADEEDYIGQTDGVADSSDDESQTETTEDIPYPDYDYSDEDEISDTNPCRYFVDEEGFGDADEYRVFAQAVTHEVDVCTLCEKKTTKKDKHLLFLCPTFKAMGLKEKCDFLQEEERCFNCLAKGHGTRTCQSRRTCSSCEKKHHSLICVKTAKPGEDVSFITQRIARSGENAGRGRGRGGRGGRGARGADRGRGRGQASS